MITEGEEECESVTEAKSVGQSRVKTMNVMEAIAQYKRRKEEEKQKLDPPKVAAPKVSKKRSPSEERAEPKTFNILAMSVDAVTQHNSRKQQEEYGAHTQKRKQEDVTPFSEKLVGITEYLHNGLGFSGILKQRYSDFQVNEVDLDGNVVHLTNQTIPDRPKEESEAKPCLLTEENWKEIDDMMKNDGKCVEINATGYSKEERLDIHKALRAKYSGIISNTRVAEGNTTLEILNPTSKKRDGREQWVGPNYTQFVLYKENMTTNEAVGDLARQLKIKATCFQYAGTKDKRAITAQLVTVFRTPPEKLLNNRSKRIKCGNFSFVKNALRLGALMGNRFHIVLRNVDKDEQSICTSMESLRENGFINYFGAQRFGTRHVPTHLIGKELILGRWKEAIDLILKPPEVVVNNREKDLVDALREWESSRDPQKAYQKLQFSKFSIEGQLLFNLKKFGRNDHVGVLATIPRNLRLTYLHAFQSYVWNTMVSKRIATYGLNPIIGDLVFPHETSVEVPLDEEGEEAAEPTTDNLTEKNNEESTGTDSGAKPKKHPIVLDATNLSHYTINDVVLPLPGFEIIYPANEVAQWYTEILESEGMADLGFKQSVKTYNLGGTYRRILCKPTDMQWRFVRYDDPTLSLVRSDADRLFNAQPHEGVKDGAYMALIVEMTLPTSAYATMALREATKMDMSPQFQTTLNDAGTSRAHQQPEAKRLRTEVDA